MFLPAPQMSLARKSVCLCVCVCVCACSDWLMLWVCRGSVLRLCARALFRPTPPVYVYKYYCTVLYCTVVYVYVYRRGRCTVQQYMCIRIQAG